MKLAVFILILHSIFFPLPAFSSTINASSCDYYDVLAAYNSANDGDTINIPSGTTTWTTKLVITGKNVSLIGSSPSGTTLINGIDNDYIIDITATDTAFEIGYLNIDGNKVGKGFYIDDNPKSFRIHHCNFTHTKSYNIWIMGRSNGCIDNCKFLSNQGGMRFDGAESGCTSAEGFGIAADTIYIEDCIIDYDAIDYDAAFQTTSHHITMNGCARVVFRYNDVNIENDANLNQIDHFDVHGCCFPARYCTRGTYLFECYENTFTFAKAFRCMNIRGGKGMIYNNDWTVATWTGGADDSTIFLNNYRSDSSLFGLCFGGSGTSCTPSEGYPCQDQINNLYIWNNTLDGVELADGSDILVSDDDDVPNHIQSGRDYFTYSGVTAIGYTSYTYPHPLRGKKVSIHGCSVTGGSFP